MCNTVCMTPLRSHLIIMYCLRRAPRQESSSQQRQSAVGSLQAIHVLL